ncbi:MAG: RNA-guided endonuclease IscB [Chloroflexi bacterium]|nr:RNA-guided endonuclease IscB [Chloroflexota bacterium]
MAQRVFVVDKNEQPLMPCHPARARMLLKKGRAEIVKHDPFTIMILDREGGEMQNVQVKIDPGSKTTGIAIVADFERGPRCIWAAELKHRGQQVHLAMLKRSQLRHGRRSRKTRYRPPRFKNRRRRKGQLPPSLQNPVNNILTWVERLSRLAPVTHLAMELAKFDTQKMRYPEISGIEYQQGTLQGYNVREYLLIKENHQCAYCGIKGVPLEVEHIIPKGRQGGSHRVDNLTIACGPCNCKKGNRTAAEFGYPHIQAQAQRPLRDAVVINTTRWSLYEQLQATGLPLEVGTGARTKYNRTCQGYPKTHWLDAVCVGESGADVFVHPNMKPLLIQATGRGSRQMCRVDKYGFPRTEAKRFKRVHGFQTGDRIKAVVPTGKKAGTYIGRVTVRTSGYFNIKTAHETAQGISYRYCRLLQRSDGYTYQYEKGNWRSPTTSGNDFRAEC